MILKNFDIKHYIRMRKIVYRSRKKYQKQTPGVWIYAANQLTSFNLSGTFAFLHGVKLSHLKVSFKACVTYFCIFQQKKRLKNVNTLYFYRKNSFRSREI